MKTACIVLASGKGNRFHHSSSKLFYKIYGTPIIVFTLKKITKFINKKSLYITIPKKISKKEKSLLKNYTKNELIIGGNSRFESLSKAFKAINHDNYEYVMVHDGARPNTDDLIITSLLKSIKIKAVHAVAPKLDQEDTLKKNQISVDRKEYFISQTPQIFKMKTIFNSVNKCNFTPTDDVSIIERKKNIKIKYIKGSKENIKITTRKDIELFKKLLFKKIVASNGFDIHKIKSGSFLSLGGLKIKSNYMSVGHSDGDVVVHSIIDAILGSLSKGDIGKYFPPLAKYKNINSQILLEEVYNKFNLGNYVINKIDCTIICQKIRLEKYKNYIRKNISKMLNCKINAVSVKAKTSDNIGLIGKSKAIACWTTITILKI